MPMIPFVKIFSNRKEEERKNTETNVLS